LFRRNSAVTPVPPSNPQVALEQCVFRSSTSHFEVIQIREVKVFAHWSVFLIGALILPGDLEEALLAVTVLAAYYGVILIHECGHMIAAQHQG
jgi:hypothetical protein